MPLMVFAAPDRSKVLPLLDGYEWQLNPARFEALPADTYLTLIEIANDDSTLSYTRGRVMVALALYENETVWLFFKNRLARSESTVQKRRAVEAICDVFLSSKTEHLKELLKPMLASSDVHLKTKAARCLGEVIKLSPDSEVEAALLAYRETIKENWERSAAGFNGKSRQVQ